MGNNLQALRLAEGYTQKRHFAKKLKVNEGNYGKMERGELSISSNVKISLADNFPNYNIDWILEGKGDKFKSEETKRRELKDYNQFTTESHGQAVTGIDVHGGAIPTANKDNKGVPYYDVDFMGGFDLIFNEQQIQPSFYIDFLPFNDCDCWINVTGKSMGPLIAHGDIVGLKKVDNWQRFLLEGEIYAVITDNGFRTIKIIGAGHDQDHFTLIPYNKSDEHKPQIIPKEVITHIFRVKGNIKKFF